MSFSKFESQFRTASRSWAGSQANTLYHLRRMAEEYATFRIVVGFFHSIEAIVFTVLAAVAGHLAMGKAVFGAALALGYIAYRVVLRIAFGRPLPSVFFREKRMP